MAEVTAKAIKDQGKPFVWGPFGKVTDEEIVLFTKKVSTMVRSGLTILDALTLVSSQTQNKVFKYAIDDIVASINMGNSLSISVRRQPKYFDEVFCNMIEAGEISGKLDSFLDRIVEGQERMQTIRKGIKSALFYPMTLVIVTLLITYGMLTKVVPTFTEMYKGMGKKLPGPTQVIVDASDWILNGWNVLSVIAVVVTIKVIHNQLFKRVYGYKKAINVIFLKLPIMGNIIIKSTIARLSLLMANLFAAGIGVEEILRVSSRITPNTVFVEAMGRISERVVSGAELSSLFAEEPIFPLELSQLIKVGEKTGNMDEMLSSIARYYQEEFEATVEGLTSMIEPLMIVFVGALIGAMVVALYLPIFSQGDMVG
ncbi:type II secretion system F family protein [Candidatus Methylopumilus planktonicus]|uniref:type II secretion system F family protein n=1 Tax=Candidatus Methylopumilus planktonicus TaxID=1581557 RepID=UPI003D18AEAB